MRHITAGVVPNTVRLNRKKRGFDVTQDWVKSGIGASLRNRIHSNLEALKPHLKKNLDLDKNLSDTALSADRNSLDEALMLAWLAEPIQLPLETITGLAGSGPITGIPGAILLTVKVWLAR